MIIIIYTAVFKKYTLDKTSNFIENKFTTWNHKKYFSIIKNNNKSKTWSNRDILFKKVLRQNWHSPWLFCCEAYTMGISRNRFYYVQCTANLSDIYMWKKMSKNRFIMIITVEDSLWQFQVLFSYIDNGEFTFVFYDLYVNFCNNKITFSYRFYILCHFVRHCVNIFIIISTPFRTYFK